MDWDRYFPRPVYVEKQGCCGDIVEDDLILVCNKCHKVFPFLIDAKYQYDEHIPTIQYKPINHLKERLDQLQGIQNKIIPAEIMAYVKGCKTIPEIHEALKRNYLSEYYEHKYLIASKMGIKLPTLSYHELQRVYTLFNTIQVKKKAGNNLPYHFLLSKLFTEIGRRDILPFLNVVKNKRRLQEYEEYYLSIF
jgi:phage antirepressor YoqD-like protein